MSKNSKITYEVKKVLAELSSNKSGYKKAVKLVSWNNAEPKIDIREWTPENTPAKGIALNEDETQNLLDGLTKYYLKQRKKQFPGNLFLRLFPDETPLPADFEVRLDAVLQTVFSTNYKKDRDSLLAYYKQGKTLEEIGQQFGITRERIRQLINRAIKRLQREDILQYLSGKTQSFQSADNLHDQRKQRKENGMAEGRDREILALTQEQLKNYDYGYEDNSDISITVFAKRLTSLKEKTMPGIITYNDLVSWFIYRGDLTRVNIDDKDRVIPTRYGNENGFYLAERENASGTIYVGLFMNKEAQEYAIFFFDEFIQFMTTPMTMDSILKNQEMYSQEL